MFHELDSRIRKTQGNIKARVPISKGFYIFEEESEAENFWKTHIPKDKHEKYLQYRKEWHRRPQECDPGEYPLSVIIELNSGCNLACNMCYTITDAFKESVVGDQRMMPWGMVCDIIDECEELRVPSILFSWRGESTLYKSRDESTGKMKDFADVLQYARQKENILEVTSLTHGQNIDDGLAERIVKAQPNWISFSVDGMGNNYNQLRKPQWARKAGEVPDVFSLVIKNINKMKSIRDQLGLERPLIRSNTVYPAIADDPYGYRQYLKDAGVDLVTVNELLEWSLHNDGKIDMKYVEEDWSCQYPFQRLTVSANGTIVPCNGAVHEESGLVVGIYSSTFNQGATKQTTANDSQVLNHAKRYSLREAWLSKELQYIREMHSSNRRLEVDPGCRNCNHGLKKKGVAWIPENWNMDSLEWEVESRESDA